MVEIDQCGGFLPNRIKNEVHTNRIECKIYYKYIMRSKRRYNKKQQRIGTKKTKEK